MTLSAFCYFDISRIVVLNKPNRNNEVENETVYVFGDHIDERPMFGYRYGCSRDWSLDLTLGQAIELVDHLNKAVDNYRRLDREISSEETDNYDDEDIGSW